MAPYEPNHSLITTSHPFYGPIYHTNSRKQWQFNWLHTPANWLPSVMWKKQCGSRCRNKGIREQRRLVEQPVNPCKFRSGARTGQSKGYIQGSSWSMPAQIPLRIREFFWILWRKESVVIRSRRWAREEGWGKLESLVELWRSRDLCASQMPKAKMNGQWFYLDSVFFYLYINVAFWLFWGWGTILKEKIHTIYILQAKFRVHALYSLIKAVCWLQGHPQHHPPFLLVS